MKRNDINARVEFEEGVKCAASRLETGERKSEQQWVRDIPGLDKTPAVSVLGRKMKQTMHSGTEKNPYVEIDMTWREA